MLYLILITVGIAGSLYAAHWRLGTVVWATIPTRRTTGRHDLTHDDRIAARALIAENATLAGPVIGMKCRNRINGCGADTATAAEFVVLERCGNNWHAHATCANCGEATISRPLDVTHFELLRSMGAVDVDAEVRKLLLRLAA